MIPEITAILLSYKRKPNMPKIVESIRKQEGVKTYIVLINNNGDETFGADVVISARTGQMAPVNFGEWARYVFAPRIETEYGMFQDDDFLMQDYKFLADAVKRHQEKCPNAFLGVSGRGFTRAWPHYKPDIINVNGYAAILKGHFQLWRKDSLKPLHIPSHHTASDIYWSMDISRGELVHWVDKDLSSRMSLIAQHGVGLEYRPGHYQERNKVCAQYIEDYGISDNVK